MWEISLLDKQQKDMKVLFTKRMQWSPIPKRRFTFCLVTFLVPLQEQPPPPPPSTPIGQIFDGELMQHLEICLCTDYLPGNLFSFQLSFY